MKRFLRFLQPLALQRLVWLGAEVDRPKVSTNPQAGSGLCYRRRCSALLPWLA